MSPSMPQKGPGVTAANSPSRNAAYNCPNSSPPAREETMTILLVEDNRFLRLATERALAKAKYRVMSVGDGEAALQAAHADLPELILLDMMLPKMTGPQVLAALKQDSV